MECGESPKSLLQVIAESLYKDENGQVFLNVTPTKVDCETLISLISCGDFVDPESLIAANLIGSDSCGKAAIKVVQASGQEGLNVRTVIEADNMLMSDEVIVLNSAISFDFYLLAASGSGRERYIKNIGTAAITINAGFGVIDDVNTITLNQWECLFIKDYADNTWIIL